MKVGSEGLSEQELIAILLRTGKKGKDVLQLAEELYARFDESLRTLSNAELEEIASVSGIGVAKATSLKAALELGKRLYKELSDTRIVLGKPDSVFEYCHDMRLFEREVLRVIIVDSKLFVVFHKDITEGTNNQTLFHPTEVFRIAVRSNANAVIIVHNHPSGDPTPSEEDKKATQLIANAGDILGIRLIDHVIVGRESYYSFRANGLLEVNVNGGREGRKDFESAQTQDGTGKRPSEKRGKA
ncbi:MAG TPA: DNA repair protein RadC [Pseudothermotoga sp.]|nr:DNA repair protein RadC [Pseudothermotoga sp.]HOK83133.1 DNA repair protein RadC [Pseudothermotoga sp.]HPP69696.1 DNA repair protein RadC [Pseudothermotoga sp.]